MSPAPACSWMAGAQRPPQLPDLKGSAWRRASSEGVLEYSTRFGENHPIWPCKQLANVRLCKMMNFSSPRRDQECQRDRDPTASVNRGKTNPWRRVAPQSRQVQHVVSPRRQRMPSVLSLHWRQRPGAVSKSQPHVQHTHLVTAPSAFRTCAPSVAYPQTLQWTFCQAVTRQSMNRLCPQVTHSQIMTGFSILGTRRHSVLWPHGSQWASWGFRYDSCIWEARRPWTPAPDIGVGSAWFSSIGTACNQGSFT